uniref:Bifunctional lysine-specific demethylase and histidyl-hydroxylase n=1 Tax=Ditylenchus dipsaci TaxID=166011 RepID=A0A915DGV8_9BILA
MFSEENSVQSGLHFLQRHLPKRALVIKRGTAKNQGSQYFKNFFTTADFVTMVQNHFIEYGTNVNIASYKSGVRSTHNGNGRVYARGLQDHLNQGHSAQCVNPQTFNDNIWYLCEILQEVLCSFVGANNYLTPANSAGFAPHWDDVDAFIVQTEGRKNWKVFAPENQNESLPMASSGNFTDADSRESRLCLMTGLRKGICFIFLEDLCISKNRCESALASCDRECVQKLHLFESTGNRLAQYLQNMLESDRQLRTSLPPLILDMAGAADLVYASDELMERNSTAQDYMQTALPPMLTPFECEHSCVGGPDLDLFSKFDFKNVKIRFIRKHTQRLVYASEETTFIVHRMQNSRVYEGRPEVTLDFPFKFDKPSSHWQMPTPNGWKKQSPKPVVVSNTSVDNNRLEMSNQKVVDFTTTSSSKKTKKNKYNKKGKKFSK